jgi:hypothetical protein
MGILQGLFLFRGIQHLFCKFPDLPTAGRRFSEAASRGYHDSSARQSEIRNDGTHTVYGV